MKNFLTVLWKFLTIKKSPLMVIGKKFFEFLLETLGGKLSDVFDKVHGISNEAVNIIEEFEICFKRYRELGKTPTVKELEQELKHLVELLKITVNFGESFVRLIALLRLIEELKEQIEKETFNAIDEAKEHLAQLKKEKRNLKLEIAEEIIENFLKENNIEINFAVIRTCISLAVVRLMNNSEE